MLAAVAKSHTAIPSLKIYLHGVEPGMDDPVMEVSIILALHGEARDQAEVDGTDGSDQGSDTLLDGALWTCGHR